MFIQTPEWVKDAVFYQIFPDRFAQSDQVAKPSHLQPWGTPPTNHGFQGGDLLGITEKLDYLIELGITAIYLNPIFQSASNHRYHTFDYFQVDPLLGGNAALTVLLHAAHSKGIRIILDGVFNHVGRGFFQFHHLLECGTESPYTDWFHAHYWPLKAYNVDHPNYDAWWGNPTLPKLNTTTNAVREFLWNVGTYWLEQGIDGWRLDVPNEIDDDLFWQEFRRRCKKINPDAYIVGELWHDAERWLKGDQFDGIMNYSFSRAAFGFLGGDTLDQTDTPRCGLGFMPAINAKQFLTICDHFSNHLYPVEIVQTQLTMLTSHDTPRLITIANHWLDTVRLLLLAQMTMTGAPNIYYGDEIGLSGKHDPDCRRAFPWHDKSSWNMTLLEDVKKFITLRKEHIALRRGTFVPVYAKDKTAVYLRTYKDDTVLVVFNASTETSTFVITESLPTLTEVFVSTSNQISTGDIINMPARSGRVWVTKTS